MANTNEMRENIINAIEEMDNGDAVMLWNEYCDRVNRYDDRIEDMTLIPELFATGDADAVFNLLNRFYFGSDDGSGEGSANPNRDYFVFNGYGNIISTDYPRDYIEAGDIADYIIENGDALYNDDIRDILDEAEAEDEDQDGDAPEQIAEAVEEADRHGVYFNGCREWINNVIGYGYAAYSPCGGILQADTLDGFMSLVRALPLAE